MTTSTTTGRRRPDAGADLVTGPTGERSGAQKGFSAVIGVASLVVLLQAVWAGLFIREGKEYDDTWVSVHARGADLAILLAAVATVLAFAKLRSRRDLWIGSGALTLLLVVEAYIGGIIGDHPAWTVVHFPLAMALMALVVYLPLRARRA